MSGVRPQISFECQPQLSADGFIAFDRALRRIPRGLQRDRDHAFVRVERNPVLTDLPPGFVVRRARFTALANKRERPSDFGLGSCQQPPQISPALVGQQVARRNEKERFVVTRAWIVEVDKNIEAIFVVKPANLLGRGVRERRQQLQVFLPDMTK